MTICPDRMRRLFISRITSAITPVTSVTEQMHADTHADTQEQNYEKKYIVTEPFQHKLSPYVRLIMDWNVF